MPFNPPTMPPNKLIDTQKYRTQHKLRLSYMPWLYKTLKPAQREWALAWQTEWQAYLQEMETVDIQGECFIAPEAKLFAQKGRPITVGEGSFIGAEAVLHGPITIGNNVGINHHVTMDGGRHGIKIGDNCRIAAYCSLYAFNHTFNAGEIIDNQKVTSEGIILGHDVWLGAHVGVVDGVEIGDGAVVGMKSIVTKHVAAATVVAGNPAVFIKLRH